MKRLIFLLVALVLTAASATVYADGNDGSSSGEPIKKLNPTPPNKPIKRSSSKYYIEYTYSNGVMTFLPADFYEMLTVTVSEMDGTDEWVEIITDDANTILLDESHSYNITAVTPDGRIFAGTVD